MTYALCTPKPPIQTLHECTDEERKIGERCWNLEFVRINLERNLKVQFSHGASITAMEELSWCIDDAKAFIRKLHRFHYLDSEWAFASRRTTAKSVPLAADAYVMGFDRMKGVENPRREPHVYFKFTVIERPDVDPLLLILSAHYSVY